MDDGSKGVCAVGVLLDLQTPEKKPPKVVPSTYTKPEKPAEDVNDHESSFTLAAPDNLDVPITVSDMKRSLQDKINDSIEMGREGSVAAEACITPGEMPVNEEIKLLDEEQFDFDIPFSPVPHKKTSLESSTCDQPSGDDDEIFFGPMGHTEKCVSKAVEDVVKEETMIKPLSPLNPQQIVQLFKEAQRVAYHITVTAPKGSDSSAGSGSVSSFQPQTLNFSNLSVNDSVLSTCTADNSVDLSPPKFRSPRQRKNTFTKEESALENLSEALNKALPDVEPLPKDKHGALKFSACGQKKAEEVKPGGFARGSAIRRSLPVSLGRGLKPVGAKPSSGLKSHGQRPSVGKCEKRIRQDSIDSVDDDAMSIASNDSEASFCTLPSGKRALPQPKLKPSSSGLKPPGQSRLTRPTKQHTRSNTVQTPGSTSRLKVESRIDNKATPTRRSLGSQPMGSKLSLPASRFSTGSGLQKPSGGLSKLSNKSANSGVASKISTTRTTSSQLPSGHAKNQPSTGTKLGTYSGRVPGKSPINAPASKPSGLAKPTIKGTMTKLDNLKPGALQRKTVPGSKLGVPGAGPMKATGLGRPGGTKVTPRNTPKDGIGNRSTIGKENTPNRPVPKPSSGTITKSTSEPGLKKVPILTTPVKAEKNVQPKRLTLQDTTNRTPRKSSDSSVSSVGTPGRPCTPVSAIKRRSFLPTPNKTLSVSSTDSDVGKGAGERSGSVGSQDSGPSPAVGVLVDIGFGTIPDTPSAFMAKPKVMSTPQANKENQPKSIWSPVRKPRMALEDEVIQCTKRFSVYQKKN